MNNINFANRKGERGVTILLVAAALVALLAMAALAIDIVTLYVARGEVQRAADAAALAGAKMFVSSGFTSGLLGSPSSSGVQDTVCLTSGPGAAAAANRQAEAVAGLNQVAGQPATVQSITCDYSLTLNPPLNPRITVTVQRTGLPTFFARIWGGAANTVTATASAEAYNPSGSSAPIKVTGVKPWLIPNCDPGTSTPGGNPNCVVGATTNHYDYFVNPADGSIANGGSFIGQTTLFTLTQFTGAVGSPGPSKYYRLVVPINPPTAVCPSTGAVSCGSVGTDDYLDNIACSSQFQFSCGQAVGVGQQVTVDNTGSLLTEQGVRCLIHASNNGPGQDQDIFTPNGSGAPVPVEGEDNNPNPALRDVMNISRSDSIVTVPLYDGQNLCPGGDCTVGPVVTVVGFLQLGITQRTMSDEIEAVILNAAGCNPGASGNAVSGGGVSPIPVRLVHN
jgi:hypothetical protein